nr:ImmA/IrrE family metallo-endopeptidase [Massilia sp. JS1662]
MNSTLKGDILEESIFRLFDKLIADGQFWGDSKACKVYRKKGYYSRDREKDIIFDLSIEYVLPGAARYSMVTLIECKNYSHSVPVDDVEEFFAKAQQVAAGNSKLVLASTAAFQEGAIRFARSKGIGLLRYFDASNFKWDLHRSPSTGSLPWSPNQDEIHKGLTQQDFESTCFEFYLQSPSGATNSLWDFFLSLHSAVSLTPNEWRAIRSRKRKPDFIVPFLERDEIEERSAMVLRRNGYSRGAVSLEAICSRERENVGLVVNRVGLSASEGNSRSILGRIAFDPLVIEIYEQPIDNAGRERFTLAHELAHHFLGHSKYMVRESCDEANLSLSDEAGILAPDITRMEIQANAFAGSLLMPKEKIIADFKTLRRWFGIIDRGHGELYLDDQPCNYQNYERVTRELMAHYRVSREAVAIRLAQLGLLRDVRTKRWLNPAILGTTSLAGNLVANYRN